MSQRSSRGGAGCWFRDGAAAVEAAAARVVSGGIGRHGAVAEAASGA